MRKHGMHGTREYIAWKNLCARCRNPNNPGFKTYGARGIKVLFNSFEDFFAHVGPCPCKFEIDRIDNSGNYAHGNVRWASRKTQMTNYSGNRRITYGGRTMTLSQWAEASGLSTATLWARIEKYQWPLAKALNTHTLDRAQISKLGHRKRWHQ